MLGATSSQSPKQAAYSAQEISDYELARALAEYEESYEGFTDEDYLEDGDYDDDDEYEYGDQEEDEEDYDEYDEDDDPMYGDFAVKPKATHSQHKAASTVPKSTASSSHHHQKHQSQQSQLEGKVESTSYPRLPPEILQIIFSMLDRSTLIRGVNLVSRQFHVVASSFIDRVGTWTLMSMEAEDELLHNLKSGVITVLKMYHSDEPVVTLQRQPYDIWPKAWERIVRLLTEPEKDNRSDESAQDLAVSSLVDKTEEMIISDIKKPKSPCLIDRVKKLIIVSPAMWTPAVLPALLPYLQSLHTLELKMVGGESKLPLGVILEACSRLDTLVIEDNDRGLTIVHCSYNSATATDFSLLPTSRITRFSVSQVRISSDTLVQLIESCPRLVHFKARDIYQLRRNADGQYMDSAGEYNPIEPLYRLAATVCPKLVEFLIAPDDPAEVDYFDHQLALTAELFPRTKHLEMNYHMPEEWTPSQEILNFLGQVTSIEFRGTRHTAEQMDRLLKHTRSLVQLSAQRLHYRRPKEEPSSFNKEILDAYYAAVERRKRAATAAERKLYYVGITQNRFQKIEKRVVKRLVRDEQLARRHLDDARSWRCPKLRVLELNLSNNVRTSADQYEDVFRFLVHACPGLVQAHLSLAALYVGQQELVTRKTHLASEVTQTSYRMHRKKTSIYNIYNPTTIEEWEECDNALALLGRLTKLEQLVLKLKEVPGVLCADNFEFMRTHNGNAARSSANTFCPRLQFFSVKSMKPIVYGKTKDQLISKKLFLNDLKAMRPGIRFSFS
ncbi:hypothetical protein BGZ94_006890 [Podila epigama]|nr:hypothetical protein BGZ94_006890 [Podila epigama]